MELLLNISWLLLTLPAYLLWRRNRKCDPLGGMLTLACVLVVLFPVISATDDLYAAQQVMEESSPGRRTLQHAGIQKTPAHNYFSVAPARLVAILLFAPGHETCGQVLAGSRYRPAIVRIEVQGSRAPPPSLFS
jgi:hypothetical protein